MPGKILSKRVQEIAAVLGWSKEDLAEKSGLPIETIRNIWYGKTEDPKISTVLAIGEATGHGVNCLMGKCQHTPQERALLRNYRACGSHGKALIELSAKYQASAAAKERKSTDTHTIRCIVPHTELGNGVMYEACDNIEIETSIEEAYIAIQIISNNLAPTYCKNDIVLIENRIPKNGETTAFFTGDKAYIRKFVEKDDRYIMQHLNGRGDDVILKRMDEVEYIGTVIGVVRK